MAFRIHNLGSIRLFLTGVSALALLLSATGCEDSSVAMELSSSTGGITDALKTPEEKERENAILAEKASNLGGQKSGSFSLLIYNIAGLPWVVSSSSPVSNTPQIGPLLNDYDIVLLQEDFWYHDDLTPGVTLPYQTVPQDTDPSVFDLHDGLNRFSKFEFDQVSRTTWKECSGYLSNSCDCLASKGFSSSMMEIGPGTKVRIYNVHLDAGESDGDVAARKAQFQQLSRDIKSRAHGEAIVVAGDVNLVETIPADVKNFDRFLADTGLVDTCRELNCTDELFDKVLFRSSPTLEFEISSRELPGKFVDDDGDDLSDHKPVLVSFLWSRD